MLLINPNEVINLAFMPREEISSESIRSLKIDIAQEDFIRPRFGQAMFHEMLEGKHPEFVENYIKPTLAQYVRASVIEELAVQISNKGVIVYSVADTAYKKQEDTKDTTKTGTQLSEQKETNSQNTVEQKTETEDVSTNDRKETDSEVVAFDITEQVNSIITTTQSENNTGSTALESQKSTESHSDTNQSTTTAEGVVSNGVESSSNESYRVASSVERRVLCVRALADAKILMAKAVRYVERNVGQFSSYEPREIGSRIFF